MSLEKAVTDLVTRLETVTKRLETVEKQLASGLPVASGSAAPAAAAGGSDGDSPAVQDYDGLISQFIQPYLEESKKFGDVVQQQAELVLKAIEEQRKLISVASKAKKPDDATLQALIKPCSDLMGKIVEIREKNRAHKLFNNLSAISEGISALGWVVVTPAPAPFVNEARGSSEFYSNRILKEFKGKDQQQCDWVNHWNGYLKELAPYIKKHHTTGLAWNPRGGDAKSLASASSSASAAPAAPPAGPPGLPPPPPASSLMGDAPQSDKKPNTGALFAELNKGDAITSGLKKVTADMKTKNRDPNDRAAVVPATQPKSAPKAAAKAGQKVGTPRIELVGNKWVIEWQINNKEIIISDTEPKHTVYIYKCEGSVVQIKGKVNAITVDNCKKTGVAFDQAIATCEVVNSNSIDIQCTLSVPSYAIDKCSGVQLYLSEKGLQSEIVSSKVDAFNVVLPPLNPTDDPLELAVPEQYKTVVKGRTLHTEIVQHSG